MKTGRILGIFAMLAALLATPAMAQTDQAVSLSGDVMVVKTITEEGAEPRVELVEPNVVVPGDRLIFRTNYKNISSETVENFVVNNPLSSKVIFEPEDGVDQLVSVDGGATFGKLADLSVTAEDGSTRPAQPSDVTNLRWILARLEPGESGQITFYAIVR